jgi:hypothetical protein
MMAGPLTNAGGIGLSAQQLWDDIKSGAPTSTIALDFAGVAAAFTGLSESSAFQVATKMLGGASVAASFAADLHDYYAAEATPADKAAAALGLVSDAAVACAVIQPEIAGPALVLAGGAYIGKDIIKSNFLGAADSINGGATTNNILAQNGVSSDIPMTGTPDQVPGSSGWSITYTVPSSSTGLQSQGLVDYYDSSTGQYVLGGNGRVDASAVTGLTYRNGNSTVCYATDSTGSPNGTGVAVTQGNGSTTITNLGSGNPISVAGTVDTSNLQPGQPVAVSTASGTYHVDPATGDITDPGAITTTVNGNTVTIINPVASNDNGASGSTFAVIQSNDASASSSNVTIAL